MKTVMRISVEGENYVCYYCEKDKCAPFHLVEKQYIQGKWSQKLVVKYSNFQSVLYYLQQYSEKSGWGRKEEI